MGGCDFTKVSFGKNVNDAFNLACDEAVREYGHQDGYNGTISTTSLTGKVNRIKIKNKMIELTKSLTTKKINMVIDFILEDCDKNECHYIELTGTYLKKTKEKYGLKNSRQKGFIFFGIASC